MKNSIQKLGEAIFREYLAAGIRFPEIVLARLSNLHAHRASCHSTDKLWPISWMRSPSKVVREVGYWPVEERKRFWTFMTELGRGKTEITPLLIKALKTERNPEVLEGIARWRPGAFTRQHPQQMEFQVQLLERYSELSNSFRLNPEKLNPFCFLPVAAYEITGGTAQERTAVPDTPHAETPITFPPHDQLVELFSTRLSDRECAYIWPTLAPLFFSRPEYRESAWAFWIKRVHSPELFPFTRYSAWAVLMQLDPQHPEWYHLIVSHLDRLIKTGEKIPPRMGQVMAAWKPRTPAQREHLLQQWQNCLNQWRLEDNSTRHCRHLYSQALAHLATNTWPPPPEACFRIQMEHLITRYGNPEEQARWKSGWGKALSVHPNALPEDLRIRFQRWAADEIRRADQSLSPPDSWQLLMALKTPPEYLQGLIASRMREDVAAEEVAQMATLTAMFAEHPAWQPAWQKEIWQKKLDLSVPYTSWYFSWETLLKHVTENPSPSLEALITRLVLDHLLAETSHPPDINCESRFLFFCVLRLAAEWRPSDHDLAGQLFEAWMKKIERYQGDDNFVRIAFKALLHLQAGLSSPESERKLMQVFIQCLNPGIQYRNEILDMMKEFEFRHLAREELTPLGEQCVHLMTHPEYVSGRTMAGAGLVVLRLKYERHPSAKTFQDWFLSTIKTETAEEVLRELAAWKPPAGEPWLDPATEAEAWATQLVSSSPNVRETAVSRLMSIWETISPPQPDWTVHPEFPKLLQVLRQETAPQVLLTAALKFSTSRSPAVIQAWNETLFRIEQQHPLPQMSTLAMVLHQQCGLERLLENISSEPETPTSLFRGVFHYLWSLVRQGAFPAVSPASPGSWQRLVALVARYYSRDEPDYLIFRQLGKQNENGFVLPQQKPWEHVPEQFGQSGSAISMNIKPVMPEADSMDSKRLITYSASDRQGKNHDTRYGKYPWQILFLAG